MQFKELRLHVLGLVAIGGLAFPAMAGDQFSHVRVIEAEAMDLTSAEIVNAEGSSESKAVRFLAKDASAVASIDLPEGEYMANIILKAENYEGDGVYLAVGKKVKRTATAHHHNVWTYGTKILTFKTDGNSPVTIEILSSCGCHELEEFGMLIDRLEVVELSRSTAVLDHWTGLNYSR